MNPVIGITSYVEQAKWGPWNQPAALVPFSYVKAVEEAGGRALVVPPSLDSVEETLSALNGLVFSGGADIDPATYGAPPDPATDGIRVDRDQAELLLMKGALRRQLPVLAICRGMQLFNVLRGGTLHQHLPDILGDREHREVTGTFSHHDVRVEEETRLGKILGTRARVASHHHQAPDRIGRGLRAVAWSRDGTVEAVEDAEHSVVAVLWHPEEAKNRTLFEDLISRASTYRKERDDEHR